MKKKLLSLSLLVCGTANAFLGGFMGTFTSSFDRKFSITRNVEEAHYVEMKFEIMKNGSTTAYSILKNCCRFRVDASYGRIITVYVTPTGANIGNEYAVLDVIDQNENRTRLPVLDGKTHKMQLTAGDEFVVSPSLSSSFFFSVRVDFKLKVEGFAETIKPSVSSGNHSLEIVRVGGDGQCKVSGASKAGKGYSAGKKVKLSAKASKGYAFAGWYDSNGNALSGTVDYRTPSYSYAMPNYNSAVKAKFVTVSDDVGSLRMDLLDKYETSSSGSFNLNLGKLVSSHSLPKLSVSGLPSGIKYDSKTQTISGKAQKPGVYTVKLKLTNASVKQAKLLAFTIEVPNLTAANKYFANNLDNEKTGAKYTIFVGMSSFDNSMPNLDLSQGVLSVKGLPSGLRYDCKSGKIVGTAKAAGIYTVYMTVSIGKSKYVSTVTVEVLPIPSWAVGSFTWTYFVGGVNATWDHIGSGNMRISSTGAFSGTARSLGKSNSMRFGCLKIVGTGDNNSLFVESSDSLASGENVRVEFEIMPKRVNGVDIGIIIGRMYGYDEDGDEYEGDFVGVQNAWELAVGRFFPDFATGASCEFNMSDFCDNRVDGELGSFAYQYGGNLKLNFHSYGSVLAEYSESDGGYPNTICRTVAVPYASADDGTISVLVPVSIKPKSEKPGFDILLWFLLDRTGGDVDSNDINFDGYNFNYSWF